MANNDVRVSALNTVTTLSTDDLSLETVVDELSATGYTSKNITEGNKAAQYLGAFTFSALDTTAKTIIDAINEIAAGGGGGGDTVTITPVLLSGTQIATFSINGVSGSIYAPTGGGGASALDDLTDVDITTPSAGDILIYDAINGEWVNVAPSAATSDALIITKTSSSTVDKTASEITAAFSAHRRIVLERTSGGDEIELNRAINSSNYLSLYFVDVSYSADVVYFTEYRVQVNKQNDAVTFSTLSSSEPLYVFRELTETLTAGNTTVEFTADNLTTSSTVDIYTDTFGVDPTAAAWSVDSQTGYDVLTLTFDAQASDVEVKVRYR